MCETSGTELSTVGTNMNETESLLSGYSLAMLSLNQELFLTYNHLHTYTHTNTPTTHTVLETHEHICHNSGFDTR